MKRSNAQYKKAKLKLNKISIVNLTYNEMMYVAGGASTEAPTVMDGGGAAVAVNTGTGGGGTNTLQTSTRTVQSMAPSAPCTGEPIWTTTISSVRVVG